MGVRQRVGMSQLPSVSKRLAALRPSLVRVTLHKQRVGKPVQANHARVEGVNEARAPVASGLVEREPASSGRGSWLAVRGVAISLH